MIGKKKQRAGWYKGDNSTCRSHIAVAHYAAYSKMCEERGIPENHRCVPAAIKSAREAVKAGAEGKTGGQKTLDAMGVKKVKRPKEFSKGAILQAVTEHVVCGQQVRTHVVYIVPQHLQAYVICGHRRSQSRTTLHSRTASWSCDRPQRSPSSRPGRQYVATSKTSLSTSSGTSRTRQRLHPGTSRQAGICGPRRIRLILIWG